MASATGAGTDSSSGGNGNGNLFQQQDEQHQHEQLNPGLGPSNNWSRSTYATHTHAEANMEFAPGQAQGTGEMMGNGHGGSVSGGSTAFHGQSHVTWNQTHDHVHAPLQPQQLPYASAGGPDFMASPYGHSHGHDQDHVGNGGGAGAGGMTPDHSAYYEYAPAPTHPTTALPFPLSYGYPVTVTSAGPSGSGLAHNHAHAPPYLPPQGAHGHGHPLQQQHDYEYPFYARPPPLVAAVPPHLHPHQVGQHVHHAHANVTTHQHQHPLMPLTYSPVVPGVGPVNPATVAAVHAPSPAHVYRRQSHELTPFLDKTGWDMNSASWSHNQGDGRETGTTPLDLSLHREGLGLARGVEEWPLSLAPPRQDRQTQTTPLPSPRAAGAPAAAGKLELAPPSSTFEYQDPALFVQRAPAPPPPSECMPQFESASAAMIEPVSVTATEAPPALPVTTPTPKPGVIVSRSSGESLREGVKRRKSTAEAFAVNGVIVQAGPRSAGAAVQAVALASGTRSASAPARATATTPVTNAEPATEVPAPRAGDQFTWKCQKCDKSCTSRNGLLRHIKHAHSVKKTKTASASTMSTSPPSTPGTPEAEAAGVVSASPDGEVKAETEAEHELKVKQPASPAETEVAKPEPEPDLPGSETVSAAVATAPLENGPPSKDEAKDDAKDFGSEVATGSDISRLSSSRHQPRIVLEKVIVTPPKASPTPSASASTSTPADLANQLSLSDELDKRSRAARHKKRSRSLTPSNSASSATSSASSTPTKTKSPRTSASASASASPAGQKRKAVMVNGTAAAINGSPAPAPVSARRPSLSKVPQTCGLCRATASTMSNLRRHYRQRHPKCKLPTTPIVADGGVGVGTFLKPGPLLPTQPDSEEPAAAAMAATSAWCNICEEDMPDLRRHKMQEHQLQTQPGFSRIGEEHAWAAVGAVTLVNGNTNGTQEDSLGEMPVLAPCQPFVQLEVDTESELCKGPVEEVEVYPPLLKREVIEPPAAAAISPGGVGLRVREVRVLVRDVGSNLTPCPICVVEYPLSEVNTHKYTHEMQCHICLRDDIPVAEMAEHGVTHVTGLRCEICGYLASRKQRLWEHFNRHAKVKPVICMMCGDGFYSKDNMRGHHKAKHEGRRDLYPCRKCGMRFSLRSQRYRHEINGHKKGKSQGKGTTQPQAAGTATVKASKPASAKAAPKRDDVNNNSNKKVMSTASTGTKSSSSGSRSSTAQPASASAAVPSDKTCQLCHKELSSNRSMLRHLLLIHGVTLTKPQAPPPPASEAAAATAKAGSDDDEANDSDEEEEPPAVNAVKKSKSKHKSRPKLKAFAYPRHRSVSHSPTGCSICGRLLSSASAVRRHQALVHNKAVGKYPEYFASQRKTCDICSQVLSSARSLQRHLVLIHNKRVGNYTKILLDNRKSWCKKRVAAAKRKRQTGQSPTKATPRAVEAQED